MITPVAYTPLPNNPTSITISEGVSLAIIFVHITLNGDGVKTVTSATLGGEALAVEGSSSWDRMNVAVLTEVNPEPGVRAFAPSWTFGSVPIWGYALEVYEFAGVTGIADLAFFLGSASSGNTRTDTVTLTDLAGKFALITGSSKDDSITNNTVGVPDPGFDDGNTFTDTRRQIVSGYVSSLASASESFDLVFNDDSAGGGTIDGSVLAVMTLVEEVNQAPVLNDDLTAIQVQEGQSVTISADVTDPNPSDTLAWTITPDITLVQGFSFNTSTGDITTDGTQQAAAAVSYTRRATDTGGLFVEDTFDIEVILPALVVDSISDSTPQPGDEIDISHSNALDDLTAGDYTVVINAPGVTRVLVPNPITFVLTGQTYPTLTFLSNTSIPLTDGTNSDDAVIQIQVPNGSLYGQITALDADGVYANDVGATNGMYAYWYDIVGEVTIDVATGLVQFGDAGGSAKYKIYNGEWPDAGSFGTVSQAAKPQSLVSIDSITANRTSAVVTFSYPGTDATGFQYNIGGSWLSATSPLTIASLAEETQYNLEIRPVNNGAVGSTTSTIFTTQDAVDTTPDTYSFNALTGQALSTPLVFGPMTVLGVDAGVDIPVTVTGGTYSVSTDGGATYGAETSAQTNVRLNYRIRVHHTTSGSHNTQTQTTLTVGGVSATATSTTLADTVPPVISLIGGNIDSWPLGTAWVEPGYSATDNADGTITNNVVVAGAVNVNVAGQYTITYSVTDSAGNTAQTTRLVTVVNQVITRTFAITSQNPVVNSQGTFINFTFPIWELWTAAPEEGGTVVDSGINFTVTNGQGSITTTAGQAGTTYLFIARSAGNLPSSYIRTEGQLT